MPAPATNKLLALTLLLVPACASNPPEPGVAASPAGEAVTLDRYTPPAPVSVSPVEELAEMETSLAAYEAQLAQNEARLQAMGVRIARADPAGVSAEKAKDTRFAEPPPARPGDAPLAGASSRPAPSAPPAPDKEGRNVRTKKTSEAKAPRANTPRADSQGASGYGKSPSTTQTATRDEARDAADDKDQEGGRCADLCDLAHATCDLEAKICDLASRHVDEPRYAEVCQRAGDDCRAAADACTLCSP